MCIRSPPPNILPASLLSNSSWLSVVQLHGWLVAYWPFLLLQISLPWQFWQLCDVHVSLWHTFVPLIDLLTTFLSSSPSPLSLPPPSPPFPLFHISLFAFLSKKKHFSIFYTCTHTHTHTSLSLSLQQIAELPSNIKEVSPFTNLLSSYSDSINSCTAKFSPIMCQTLTPPHTMFLI